jgi:hypothetical protein
MATHYRCKWNCGGTDCPATKRLTATTEVRCAHKNGWYVTARFWLFKRRLFVCSDCGEALGA